MCLRGKASGDEAGGEGAAAARGFFADVGEMEEQNRGVERQVGVMDVERADKPAHGDGGVLGRGAAARGNPAQVGRAKMSIAEEVEDIGGRDVWKLERGGEVCQAAHGGSEENRKGEFIRVDRFFVMGDDSGRDEEDTEDGAGMEGVVRVAFDAHNAIVMGGGDEGAGIAERAVDTGGQGVEKTLDALLCRFEGDEAEREGLGHVFAEVEGLEDVGAESVAIVAGFKEEADGVWVGGGEGMAKEAMKSSGGKPADRGEAVETKVDGGNVNVLEPLRCERRGGLGARHG